MCDKCNITVDIEPHNHLVSMYRTTCVSDVSHFEQQSVCAALTGDVTMQQFNRKLSRTPTQLAVDDDARTAAHSNQFDRTIRSARFFLNQRNQRVAFHEQVSNIEKNFVDSTLIVQSTKTQLLARVAASCHNLSYTSIDACTASMSRCLTRGHLQWPCYRQTRRQSQRHLLEC